MNASPAARNFAFFAAGDVLHPLTTTMAEIQKMATDAEPNRLNVLIFPQLSRLVRGLWRPGESRADARLLQLILAAFKDIALGSDPSFGGFHHYGIAPTQAPAKLSSNRPRESSGHFVVYRDQMRQLSIYPPGTTWMHIVPTACYLTSMLKFGNREGIWIIHRSVD